MVTMVTQIMLPIQMIAHSPLVISLSLVRHALQCPAAEGLAMPSQAPERRALPGLSTPRT